MSAPHRLPRPSHVSVGSSNDVGRPRPATFRALGNAEPPARVSISGESFSLSKVYKHDSWAATALYRGDEGGWAICKFNRQQGIGPISMKWLGRLLARNEAGILRRLADVRGIPLCLGDVHTHGCVQPNAVARQYIPGQPLGRNVPVDDAFFPELKAILQVMHRRGMAYVDLHKRENVLVGHDGRPYLIDFQISFAPTGLRARLPLTGLWLRILQRSDDYHVAKMVARIRPDQANGEVVPPWWIRAHRLVAQPFRSFRRRLLVRKGIRTGAGRAVSEHFTEEALRTN